MNKFRELAEEFRTVVAGRANLLDTIAPPVVFVIVIALGGFEAAMWSALVLALIIAAVRLLRRQSLLYALGGVGGVLVAILIARLLDRAEGFFLPGIASSAVTVLICLGSILAGRPMVAWSSYIARRWPWRWYWHPRVRPAYTEVTAAWMVFFALRLWLQLALFQSEQAGALAVIQFILGWPATIVLLVVSYLYGTWRLQHLQGPSVDEVVTGAEPPWTGQRRGF